MANYPSDEFRAEIAEHMAAERAMLAFAGLRMGETTNNAELDVRLRGCFVTGLFLESPTSGEIVNVLYSDMKMDTTKLPASHVMLPVGPSAGIGGQHGYPRWADYHEFYLEPDDSGAQRMSLQAKRSDMGLAVAKLFSLSQHELITRTTVSNPAGTRARTSLGEHLYFRVSEGQIPNITLNDNSIDDVLGEGAVAKVLAGDSLFVPGADSQTYVEFPGEHTILLETHTEGVAEGTPTGMLVWHKMGTDSICLEPTIGYTAQRQNDALVMEPGGSVTLQTTIEAV